jgi:phosphatidylglycerophosphatase A
MVDPRKPAGTGSFADNLAEALATSFGLGLAPVAPGTVGSLAGVGLFWWLRHFMGIGLTVMLVLTIAGVWAATRVGERSGDNDPSRVVIDEVVGQFLTLWSAWNWEYAVLGSPPEGGLGFAAAGFLLFRLFDIVKPPPVRQLERLKAGWGVMADDVMAGVYAGLALLMIDRWGIL